MKLLALAASLVPMIAFADDAPPPNEPISPPGMTDPNHDTGTLAAALERDPAALEAATADAYTPCFPPYRPRRGFVGIGFAKGHIGLDNDTDGRQKALLVRAQGRRGFGLELELARTNIGDDRAKTGGGALYKAWGRHVMPYVLVGAGRGTIDRASGAEDHMRYAEWGGGLMLKGRRLAIGVDIRKGMRRVDADTTYMPTLGTPAIVMPTDDDRDRYVRGRVMAFVTF